MISYTLYKNVIEDLSSCTRMQTLALAALGLERLWRMFYDWTETEGDDRLYQKPISFRRRARDILDSFWEQIENRQEINGHGKEHRSFLDFINASCDENEAPDVDMGTGGPLLMLMFGGVHCFFSLDAESSAAECITEYAGYLEDILYDRFCDKCKESISHQGVSQQDWTKLLGTKIEAAIVEDPLWKEELKRIQEDFRLVKNFPNDLECLRKRKMEIQQMDYIT